MTKEQAVQEYYDNVKESEFVTWLAVLVTVAIEKHGLVFDVVGVLGPKYWWEYYNKGMTPEDALLEDMQSGL